jgi:hypothetical protein
LRNTVSDWSSAVVSDRFISTAIMTEVPLIYPCHVTSPRRYVVGQDRTIQRVSAETSSNGAAVDTDNTPSLPVEDVLPGSASVSSLMLRGKDVILTTSALLDCPDVLCVALSWTVDPLQSPQMMQLDLRELTTNHILGERVQIRACLEDQNIIRLVLIDNVGTFLTIKMTESLTPLHDQLADLLSMTDYIEETPVQEEISGSELQSTMVCFLSPTIVCLALAPFVVTVDIRMGTSAVWSETQCVEDMKSRNLTLGSMFHHATDLLLGKLNVGLMDMPPTAALCVASKPNPLLDATFIFSLHSDASIRKWIIDPEVSLLPIEVTSIECSNSDLPLPLSWSDTRNSVSLRARLYAQGYALAVHIKTNAAFQEAAEYENEAATNTTTTTGSQSDCHLWVVHGLQSSEATATETCLPLSVPKEAMSLVGMDFVPTSSRCSFSVLFQSVSETEDRVSTMQLTYPPSMLSILSSQPYLMDNKGSLDTVATNERARIRALSFSADILEESSATSTSGSSSSNLEQDLHSLDTIYMKYLFRPIYPRGTGTVLPPSVDYIRQALSKLVQGYRREPDSSLQLETLRAMHDWRNKENRKLFAMTPVKAARSAERRTATDTDMVVASPFSVYLTFVHDDEDEDMDMDDDGLGEADELDQERTAQVEAHENRWRRFLLQVWEEEQMVRQPLCVSWLDTTSVEVIVRAGIITVMTESCQNAPNSSSSSSPLTRRLDEAAMKLLTRIENDGDKASQLYLAEQRVGTLVSKALLAVSPLNRNKVFVEILTNLGQWALAEEEESGGISDSECGELEQTVSRLSLAELLQWLQHIPLDATANLVGLDLFSCNGSSDARDQVTWSQNQVANCQLRHAACDLSVRCIDSVRRLQLSRCLLLLDLVEGGHATHAAIRAYLHSIAVLWAVAQHVPMPSTSLQSKRREKVQFEGSPDMSSPPNKRLSFGDDASSILAPLSANMTTTMDALMINISQTMDESTSMTASPVGAAVLLGQSFFNLAFSSGENRRPGKPSLLPELGSLPLPRDESIATDYPRLALRLLAPFVAFTLPEESPDVVTARNETLAECLLIESHAHSKTGSDDVLQVKMKQRACELLVPAGSDHNNPVDQRMIRTALDALSSLNLTAPPATIPNFDDLLASMLQKMIYGETSVIIAIEIRRLCELESVKLLFAPLVTGLGRDFDDVTCASVHLLAKIMLHLSRLMHRLTILERHVGNAGQTSSDDSNSSSGMLLEFIVNAITEMGILFPIEICQEMPEYINLWSRLFHHAVVAGHWEQAYAACVSNPASERRDSNFKRLVRAMVDSGALQDLLEKCTSLSVRSSGEIKADVEADGGADECVDLYEISSEILAESISRDVYTVRAASPEPSGLSDYQGALYALHASQKQWRRAAQSMDFRFINGVRALSPESADISLNLGAAVLRDGLIVEDLVLAAAGAMNAIELVKDSAHRFLVSGELGPYHSIPIDGYEESQHLASRIKRTRGSLKKKDGNASENAEDRISNFMTLVELEGRAIRSITLRTLFFDGSSDPSFAKSAFLREFDSSNIDIDELFKHGYYRYGLLLAKAMSKNYEALTGSSRPEGQDLFYDSLSYMLYTYVVPLSAQGTVPGTRQGTSMLSRPSLGQLHTALDDVGATQGTASYICSGRSKKRSAQQVAALSEASMALLRKLTVAHSTAENPVALNVASFFLDQCGGNDAARLPPWLERLLTGADLCTADQSIGLFARRPKPGLVVYSGDPSALVSLYTKRGMLGEACEVIASTLSGFDGHQSGSGSRESRAPSRLPEKGDIDFVPYQKIDVLWNLIELALSKGAVEKAEANRMRDSREKMELALEKHFSLMNISEMGMRSARALS